MPSGPWFWGHRCLHRGSAEISDGLARRLPAGIASQSQAEQPACTPELPPVSSTLPFVMLQPLLVTEATGWALVLGKLPKKTAFPGPAPLHSCALTLLDGSTIQWVKRASSAASIWLLLCCPFHAHPQLTCTTASLVSAASLALSFSIWEARGKCTEPWCDTTHMLPITLQ